MERTMKTATLSDLRQNIYTYFEDVAAGEKLLVIRSGKVVGVVLPFSDAEDTLEEDFDPIFLADLRARARDGQKEFVSFDAFDRSLQSRRV